MKDGIHPRYLKCVVTCACGATFETGAAVPTMRIDICSACHPFYTGRQKFVDTAGRVDKFRKRYSASIAMGAKDQLPAEQKEEETPAPR